MTRENGGIAIATRNPGDHNKTSPPMVCIETNGGVETICLFGGASAPPGENATLRGRWRQRDVLLKAYFGVSRDDDFKRESRGLESMARVGIAAPSILCDGIARSGALTGARCLLLECPPEARPVGVDDIGGLLDALEQLHAHGLRCRHSRIDGLLVANGTVCVVDGANVCRRILPRSPMADWVELLAQFDVSHAHLLDAALVRLARQRCWPAARRDRVRQRLATLRWRRTRRLMRGINHESELVRRSRGPGYVCLSPRQAPEIDLPDDLDWYFEHGDMLKADQFSSVVHHDGLVIKRDNRSGILHVLRHNLKSSRARGCWRGAYLLGFLGIPTAPPRALVEYRKAGLRTRSYFIADEIEGVPLDRYVRKLRALSLDPDDPSSDWAPLLNALEGLFSRLAVLRLTTHDTKASNIIVRRNVGPDDGGEELTLSVIDLDRAVHRRWAWTFNRAHPRDYRRFIKSWEHYPEDIPVLGPTFMRETVGDDGDASIRDTVP